jgi:WD40 repeat protein
MASRLLVIMLVAMALVAGVNGWCEKTHFAETSTINEIDFSPDRTMVLTASSSKKMIVWNFSSFEPIFTLNCTSTVKTAKFSKDQKYIAVGQSSNNVNIIQVSTFTSITNVSTGCNPVNEVDFSWDYKRLLVCGNNAI